MRIWITLLITGSIITGLGIIFHFQGKSLIGPQSSFMYANPDWITYGIEILIFGIAVIVISCLFSLRNRENSRN